MLFSNSAHPIRVSKSWTKRVPGFLTDLNLSKDGSTALVAVVPDQDSLDAGANRSKYFAIFYSSAGKVLSRIEMPAQIKSQSLSADGEMGVIATYDDKLRAFNRDGKLLWETEGFCKPFVLSTVKKILCFHDDDAEPELGFEVFDWKGKKSGQYPIHDDALTLKMASDEKSFVMALTRGKVIVFDLNFRPVFHKSVSGEVVDVAVSARPAGPSARPALAILYNQKKSAQQKLFYRGEKSFDSRVPDRADQIELSPNGAAIFAYSNTPEGQAVFRPATKLGHRGVALWKRAEKNSAEYSSQISVGAETVWAGFQDASTTGTQRSHVLGFDFDGALRADIGVPAQEGAFLYTFAVAPAARAVVIGSDDGNLSFFKAEE